MSITYRVHIDFDDDGSFGAGDEITAYVKQIDLSGGIQEALANTAPPGTYRLVVNNADRRFSPSYSGGAYYGKLLPNKPVRVQVLWGASTYTIFQGVTRSFRPAAGQFGPRETIIECADALGALADYPISLPLQRGKTADALIRLITSAAYRSARAEGTITFAGPPASGDNVSINGTTYTFRSALTPLPGEVLIGSGSNAVESTIDNLLAAINGGSGAGTTYASSTSRPADCTASPRADYYRTVQADRPMRYYRLGEGAGTSAADAGTNNAAATYVNSPTLGAGGALSGDSDTAVTFNGTNQYLTAPTLALNNRSFTLEMWVKPTASPPAVQDLLSIWSSYATRQNLILRLSNGTDLIADFYNEGVQANGVITVGAWNCIALTYNSVADSSQLYVNGALVAGGSAGPFEGANPQIFIGANAGPINYAKASLDEVAIYLGALSAAQVAAHYAARTISRGIYVQANARGAWGNVIPLAKSGANISLSGSTLGGGVDGPAGALATEGGLRGFDTAGDQWSSEQTRAWQAIDDAVRSEQGLFWAARAGTLTFKNGDYLFRQAATTAALTLDSQENALEAELGNRLVFNRVTVSYRPRASLVSGVIARARGVIQVPGLWGKDRVNPSDDLPGGGLLTVKLPYVDPGTGQLSGAQSLSLPLTPGTDYFLNDRADGTGFDYTYTSNITFSVAANGADVEVSLRNTALGPLFVRSLQVQGVGIVAYDPQQITLDDPASQAGYGRRALALNFPLAVQGAQTYAQATAEYQLSRWTQPAFRAGMLIFEGQTVVNGVNVYALDIGDVIALTDYQTGAAAQRYLITGLEYSLRAGAPAASRAALHVRRLDDVTYWVLADTTLGALGTSTRIAI